MEFNMKNEMTKNIFTNVFLFMNFHDILNMTKVNSFFRSILINDNNRWHSVCFNEIYNFVLYNIFKKTEINCLFCLLEKIIKFEENIDYIVERYNEMYKMYYKLFILIMNEYSQMCKKIKCICEVDDVYNMSKICSSSECLCIEKFKLTLKEWFPNLENISFYKYNSLIEHTLLYCKYIQKEKYICEMCYEHFEENDILWIDECILYKCHLMVSEENCTCGLMSICKVCRKKL